jgi:hypothetical protein
MREKCVISSAAADTNSMAKSRSLTASSEFSAGRVAGAGQRGGAQRHDIDAPAAVGKALAVARQHLEPGQQVVTKRDWLRRLQVREARHQGVRLALGQPDQN